MHIVLPLRICCGFLVNYDISYDYDTKKSSGVTQCLVNKMKCTTLIHK